MLEITQNWWKSPYYRLGISSKFCHFCNVLKTLNIIFISIYSSFRAEQNGTNNFVIACTVVEILLFVWSHWRLDFVWFLQVNNSATEHGAKHLFISFYSESNAHSNDITISNCFKIPEIGENPLIIDLVFHQNFAIFAMCSKH